MTVFDGLPHTSLMAAFLAGLLSFTSSCVLPVVPSYLASVTGLSCMTAIGAGASARLRATVMINSLLFICGFSILFTGFGASAGGIGQLLMDHQIWIRKSGAVLIVLLGLLAMRGFVKPIWRMKEVESRCGLGWIKYAGSFLIGATFASGWTPCVGPVLGTTLQYASNAETSMDGMTLLIFHSLGLGLPLVVLSVLLNGLFTYFRNVWPYLGLVGSLGGLFLIVLGAVLYTDRLGYITGLLDYAGVGIS